jgi:hypothetical protein
MFWGKDPKKEALIELYTSMLLLVLGNEKESKKMAKTMIEIAIQDSENEGSNNLPSNLGDIILSDSEASDPKIKALVENVRKRIPAKKEAGVTDDDIRWIWNLDDIERRMMEKFSDLVQMALYMKTKSENSHLGEEEASKKAVQAIRKYHPIYGDPNNDSFSQDTEIGEDNLPLPYELRNRINKYVETRNLEDNDKFKNEIEASSSFNALIRREIQNGSV